MVLRNAVKEYHLFVTWYLRGFRWRLINKMCCSGVVTLAEAEAGKQSLRRPTKQALSQSLTGLSLSLWTLVAFGGVTL